MMPALSKTSIALLLTASVWASSAGAQEADTLRQRYWIPAPATIDIAAQGPRTGAGVSISTPSAYGADFGDAFLGLGVQATTRAADRPDAGVVMGFGLGSATRYVGLETAIGLFGTVRSCCRGGVSFKVHRVLPWSSAIAVGIENGAVWGELAPGVDVGTDSGTSVYAAATKVMHLGWVPGEAFRTWTATVGVGNGRFRQEDDILEDREAVNPFGSVSVSLARTANAIVNWTGQDLAVGASWAPHSRVPFYVNPSIVDLTTSPRFVVGVGYGFDFGSMLR